MESMSKTEELITIAVNKISEIPGCIDDDATWEIVNDKIELIKKMLWNAVEASK